MTNPDMIPKQNLPKGATAFRRFENLLKRLISVPKEEVDKEKAEYERRKRNKK